MDLGCVDSAFVSLVECEAVNFREQEERTLFKVLREKETLANFRTNRFSSLNVFVYLSLLLFYAYTRDFFATNLLLWLRKVSSFITFLNDCLKRCLGSVSEGVLRPPGGFLELVEDPFQASWRRLEPF